MEITKVEAINLKPIKLGNSVRVIMDVLFEYVLCEKNIVEKLNLHGKQINFIKITFLITHYLSSEPKK